GLIQVLPMLTSLSEIHTIHWSGDLPERLNSTFFLLCCWRLWNHRNEVVFQHLAPSINRLLRCCVNDAKLWANRFKLADRAVLPSWLASFSSPLLSTLCNLSCLFSLSLFRLFFRYVMLPLFFLYGLYSFDVSLILIQVGSFPPPPPV
uniref:Uncharacterized protein n=1 Tax=Oryza glaberrima TaxID=4538 RepID=I1QEU2_ORYGL